MCERVREKGQEIKEITDLQFPDEIIHITFSSMLSLLQHEVRSGFSL